MSSSPTAHHVYRAWDGKSYRWPPPAGWAQSVDGSWWPAERLRLPPPPAYRPPGPAVRPTPPAPVVAQTPSARTASLVAMGGGFTAVAVGSLLPWASITTAFGTASMAGTSGDGVLTLGLAVLGLLGTIMATVNRVGAAMALVAVGLSLWIAVYDIGNVTDAVASSNDGSGDLLASVGAGLWLVLVGSIVAGTGGLVGLGAAGRRRF